MTDAGLLLTIALASVVVVPAVLVAAYLIAAAVEASEWPDDRADERAHGDWPSVPPGLAVSDLLHAERN